MPHMGHSNKKPQFSEESLGVNPFVNDLEILVREIEFKNQYKKSDDILLPVTQDIEYTEYTKLYSSSERRQITNNLTLRAKEMFLWLMYELEAGKDYIWINKVRYMNELQIKSVNTFKEAIENLTRYGYITPTIIKDVYWINPDLFFRGDRVKKYKNKLNKI